MLEKLYTLQTDFLEARGAIYIGKTLIAGMPDSVFWAEDPKRINPIAVTRWGCRSPSASTEELWDLLLEGKPMLWEISEARFGRGHLARFNNSLGNFLRDIEAFYHKYFMISPREAVSIYPQQRISLQAAYKALKITSGYLTESFRPEDIGCSIGACATNYDCSVASHPPTAYSAIGTPRSRYGGKLSHYFERTRGSIYVSIPVLWKCTAANLENLRADVFENFDCCYAGDLGIVRASDRRLFEYLGATSAGSTTRGLGKHPFTSGLLWTLEQLAENHERFMTPIHIPHYTQRDENWPLACCGSQFETMFDALNVSTEEPNSAKVDDEQHSKIFCHGVHTSARGHGFTGGDISFKHKDGIYYARSQPLRQLIPKDEESDAGTDQDSLSDSIWSLKSEDTLTSVDTEACSNDFADSCIDETISRLKMERADCLQNIELWEKALQIVS